MGSNATRAAIEAGYSPISAAVTGHRLLRDDNVQRRIKELSQLSVLTLADIMMNAKTPQIRLKAASKLIDIMLLIN